MRDGGLRGFTAIDRRQDDVADADQFGLLHQSQLETSLQAIPVTVINRYRCLVPIEDRIDAER